MYLSFYGLREAPFATTPDPRFLHLTPGHREALAHLVYGVQADMGFLVLTGEVGTGKTTLLRALLERLGQDVTVALVVNSGLTFDEIMEYVCQDLAIPDADGSRARRLFAFHRYLVERARAGGKVALILDEAHLLDAATLEQVRLLSNFESPTRKLVQILLVGQPELTAQLKRPELRQLWQRIGLRCSIPPLSADETGDYIRWRLEAAGAVDTGTFSEDAIRAVAAHARGIPRVVNILCDHCLLIGYAEQRRRVDAAVVKRAVRYLDDGGRRRRAPSRGWWWRWMGLHRLAWTATPILFYAASLPTLVPRGDGARASLMAESVANLFLTTMGRLQP